MSRLIDADVLLARVVEKKPEVGKTRYVEGFNAAIMRVRSMISTAPTVDAAGVVDAVEVVRCAACEYSKLDENGNMWCMFCNGGGIRTMPHGYCWYGRRKENESGKTD